MPKLRLEEIEIMLDDELDHPTAHVSNKNVNHKLEIRRQIRRRLENYFEHKQLKKDLGYDYFEEI